MWALTRRLSKLGRKVHSGQPCNGGKVRQGNWIGKALPDVALNTLQPPRRKGQNAGGDFIAACGPAAGCGDGGATDEGSTSFTPPMTRVRRAWGESDLPGWIIWIDRERQGSGSDGHVLGAHEMVPFTGARPLGAAGSPTPEISQRRRTRALASKKYG